MGRFLFSTPPLTVSVPFSSRIVSLCQLNHVPAPKETETENMCMWRSAVFPSKRFPPFFFTPPRPVYRREVLRPDISPFPSVAIRGQGIPIRLPPFFPRPYFFNWLTTQEVESAGKPGTYGEVKSTGRNCQGGYLPFFLFSPSPYPRIFLFFFLSFFNFYRRGDRGG